MHFNKQNKKMRKVHNRIYSAVLVLDVYKRQAYMSAIHENLDPMDFLPYAKLSDEFIQKEQEEESQKEQEREDQKDSEAEKDSEADQKDSEKDETKKEPADTNTSAKNNNSEDTNCLLYTSNHSCYIFHLCTNIGCHGHRRGSTIL